MFAYTGKILRVDLTSGQIWDEPLNETYARDYVGGSGLAARYLFEMAGPKTDPLRPDNPLIFMTGPMVATRMPSSGRHSVCALSPLTRIWGEANSGGFFGPELRFAGYDGVIITGKAGRPVWLSIFGGCAGLHPADELWGGDSYTTQERIRQTSGQPKARVACIGLAGENRVKMAGVINDHGRMAARTGMGAVMGSKNLKAIAVSGSARVVLAYPERLKRVVQEILSASQVDVAAQAIRLAGTAGYLNMSHMYGDLPIRYFQKGEWEEAENLSGVLLATQYQNRNTSCYRCPIACGRETRAPRYGAGKVDGPEYETLGSLGSLTMVSDLESVIYAGHLCNQYGLDSISVGGTIALACELTERGLLTPAHTGGLEIRYGDGEMVVHLVEMIARREGFGDLLAEGSAALAEFFGVPELSVTVKRLEVPMHDPRAFTGMAVSYALSPRGACHMQGDMYSVDTGSGPAPELGVPAGERFENTVEKGRIAARQQAWRSLYNSLILCQFQNPGVALLLEALNAATGWDLNADELLNLGKRIVTLKRILNARYGMTRQDDRLPDLLMNPLKEGGTGGALPDLPSLLSGAYEEFGWDPATGQPTEQTLRQHGIPTNHTYS